MSGLINILMVEDHALVRMGISHFICGVFGKVNFVEAEDIQTALALLRKQSFNLILLDMDLPDGTGLDLMPEIKNLHPKTPVLFLTGIVDEDLAMRVMRAGAAGYVDKGSKPEELRKAVTVALQGGRYISGKMAASMALHSVEPGSQSPEELLSDREYQVLRLIGSGKTVTEIGESLSLSVKTVSTYRARLLEKLNLHNTAELVRYALKKGLAK